MIVFSTVSEREHAAHGLFFRLRSHKCLGQVLHYLVRLELTTYRFKARCAANCAKGSLCAPD